MGMFVEATTINIDAAKEALEIKRQRDEGLLLNDEQCYRLYYCESQDEYLLGHRVQNFYYAHWSPRLGWVFDMSRYLPWGETVHDESSAWKVHTYPSEPVELGQDEWFRGFLKMVERKKGDYGADKTPG